MHLCRLPNTSLQVCPCAKLRMADTEKVFSANGRLGLTWMTEQSCMEPASLAEQASTAHVTRALRRPGCNGGGVPACFLIESADA